MPVFGASPDYNNNLPIDQVKSMKAQGMGSSQIIEALQRDGFSSTSIFEAMNQAEMASADQLPKPGGQQDTSFDSGSFPQQGGDFLGQPSPPKMSGGEMPLPQSHSGGYTGDVSTEELVEAIIDEKWSELVKDIRKIIEWKTAANNKILSLEQHFNDLKQEFDKIHTAILSKIDDYDRNITNVGAEVRAMEKVFSKVLPVFTENVSELSRISRDLKKSPSSKKSKKD